MEPSRPVQSQDPSVAPIDGDAITQMNVKEMSMFTKFLVVAAALTAAVVTTAPAQAESIHVGVGLGFGGGYYDDGYYGGGYYGGGYYPVYGGDYGGISCSKAKKIVQNHGFYKVYPTDCGGKYMRFKARKDGDQYRVKVDRRGHIVDVDSI
jgi:hypothetical protein